MLLAKTDPVKELATDTPVLTLITPLPSITIPDPILTPPRITLVAVCRAKLPVVTDITPSSMLIPVPI
jgi:hypothetical protein